MQGARPAGTTVVGIFADTEEENFVDVVVDGVAEISIKEIDPKIITREDLKTTRHLEDLARGPVHVFRCGDPSHLKADCTALDYVVNLFRQVAPEAEVEANFAHSSDLWGDNINDILAEANMDQVNT